MVPAVATSVVVAVLAIVGILLALSGGDDGEETRRVETPLTRASTTSTSFRLPLTTTTPPTVALTVPPTSATPPTQITPGSVAIVPGPAPAPAPAPAPTPAPADVPAPSTTTTTKPKTVPEELAEMLETELAGGTAPVPGSERGVVIEYESDERVRVTWPLDETRTGEDLRIAARVEATAILRVIQGYDRLADERVVLRATLPDADGFPERVLRLLFERATLDAIDFTTIDPLTIFELADEAEIEPILLPTPTTTSTSTTTTKP